MFKRQPRFSVALIGTHKDHSSALFWRIVTQHVDLQANPVVCWKFCHVVHRLMRDGHPKVRELHKLHYLQREMTAALLMYMYSFHVCSV